MTTLKIGGSARYFCSARSAAELREAARFAREREVPLLVLGGGSNVLVSDEGLNALVVKIEIRGVEMEEFDMSNWVVIAGAGENWDALVAEVVKRGLWGIENLSGIPGTVGAAPVQNIGAYGAELTDVLLWVEVFTPESGEVRRLSREECGFGYRDSVFKKPEGKNLIITRVALQLSKNGLPNLEYKDLKERFKIYDSRQNATGRQVRSKKEKPTLQEIRNAVLEIRGRKFPDLARVGTAGSFFKNPIISKEKFETLKMRFPDLPGFPLPSIRYPLPSVKIPLAWVLDNICGLKGFQKGNVELFKRQPIVLVQNGFASAEEVELFAKKISRTVKLKTGIDIEWEVRQVK